MSQNPTLFHHLLHSSDLVEERLRLKLAPLGVHPRQARILSALHRIGESSQVRLAREFDVSKASMSTMTARLVSAGYISRMADPNDHRGSILRLSEKGQDLLSDIDDAWVAVDDIIRDALGQRKMFELETLLSELCDYLGG